jgi:hypothetical protein
MRDRDLSILDDRHISPGSSWRDEFAAAISEADVAVLLISPDYVASDFVQNHELPLLLMAAEERGLRVISVIISDSL